MARKRIVAAALSLLIVAASAPALAQTGVGQVSFVNSGAPQAQPAFLRGLALLHNFEYPRAAAAFREAQAADPGFVMAYWGEAMAYNHPVWMEQFPDQGREALARLGPDRAARLARTRTDRERAYLDAVEALYGEGSKEERDRAYSERMAAIHAAYPDDVDATAFYALSLLGLAHEGRDFGLYMRSAALLEAIYPQNVDHPGVLHYLIHSYDDPVHAPLGLRAARRYGAIAPDAPHALHMTSHIFLALGMWDEVIAANRASTEADRRLAAAAGRQSAQCSHGREWLFYALYQTERNAEADALRRACLEDARREAAAPLQGEPGQRVWPSVRSYADMAIRTVVETGARPADEALELSPDRHAGPRFTLAYADLLAARADPAAVREASTRLQQLARSMAEAGPGDARIGAQARRRHEIVLAQAAGLERLAAGDAEAGLAELRRAAELERATPVEFGPPSVEKPSQELLADELLRLGRLAEAAQAYRSALLLAPGRRLSSQGLELAQRSSTPSAETAAATPAAAGHDRH